MGTYTFDGFNFNSAKLLGTRYASREIVIKGWVKGTTVDNLWNNWGALQLKFSGDAKQLKAYRDSADRYYVATLRSLSAPQTVENLLWIAYEAIFTVATPFALAAAASQNVQSNKALTLVSGNEYKYGWTIAAGGTVFADAKFTIDIPVGGPYGMTKLWIVNTSLIPPLKLMVTETFAASDQIVIDGETYEVKINGTPAGNTEGAFPVLDPRILLGNELEIHAIATSQPTLSVTTDWRKRYL